MSLKNRITLRTINKKSKSYRYVRQDLIFLTNYNNYKIYTLLFEQIIPPRIPKSRVGGISFISQNEINIKI